MALLLHLATSNKACSVAISKDGKLLALKEINTGEFSHAENLNIFIQDVLKETQLELKNVDAVVVSAREAPTESSAAGSLAPSATRPPRPRSWTTTSTS